MTTSLFVKPSSTDREAMIEGYAAIFRQPDLTGDIILPGAFKKSAMGPQKLIPGQSPRVMMLYQHKAENPIGRWHHIEEDDRGLYVKGSIFTQIELGRDVYSLVEGRALDGLSIGFKVDKSRRTRRGQRELHDVTLWEISIVTFPMAPMARIMRHSSPGHRHPRNLLDA
ncbi:MAG: HK97 family phage prohead protease [Pseudomonadota bacterium]